MSLQPATKLFNKYSSAVWTQMYERQADESSGNPNIVGWRWGQNPSVRLTNCVPLTLVKDRPGLKWYVQGQDFNCEGESGG